MTPNCRRYGFLMLALFGALLLLVPALTAPAPPDPDALADRVLFDAGPRPLAQVAAPQLPPPAAPIPLPDPVWRIGVSADGLYTLDRATLTAAGVPTDVALSALRLFWRGQEVALEETAAALFFYGEQFHGARQAEEYTDENVYWLTVDTATPGLRMATRAVAPTGAPAAACRVTALAEENLRYWARASIQPGTETTWFWEYINTPTTLTRTYPIALTAPLTTGAPATLVVEVASFNTIPGVNPDHQVRLTLNATGLGDFYWNGQTGHVITASVPAAALLAGANTLRVAYVTDLGHQSVYFDRATLTYHQSPAADGGAFACETLAAEAATYPVVGLAEDARLYDVSDPLRPIALTGGSASPAGVTFSDLAPEGTRYRAAVPQPLTPTRYIPASDLLAPGAGADQIIIAPQQFFAALAPLVAQRQSQGWRVALVDVADIYPLFNGGVFHPEALRAFVAYAHAHWPGPAVQYLFLVGGGNFNFKGYNPTSYGEHVPTLIPPYREFADPTQGDVPVDARFGDVDGDGLPEVFVGRLPAHTIEEVAGYVAKVLAYEAQPPEDWQLHTLLVADNGDGYDEGFGRLLNRLAAQFPTAMTTETVYMLDFGCAYSGRCPAATAALLQGWNAGAGLLVYAGHGSIHRWAHEPLIFNTELAALTQTARLPFVLALDCWDGYWMFPPKYHALPNRDVRSMGQWVTTVLTETGAIAAYGPAGLAYAASEEALARAMFTAAFERGVFDLGTLSQAGREVIRHSYEARTYTLFGDPALTLAWWESLHLTPQTATLNPGSVLDLAEFVVSEGRARFGQTFAVTPRWTVSAGGGDAYGVYTAPGALGPVYLTGHLGAISATLPLTVVGPPVAVTVTPNPLVLAPEAGAQMTATPRDAFGSPLPLTTTVLWESNVGAIDASGRFTAPAELATGWITATLPISQGTHTIWLTGAAAVEVRAMSYIYLPLVLKP